MSFLDIVSCGFGAILLLLIISKISEPQIIESITADLSGVVQTLEQRQVEIKTQTQQRSQALAQSKMQLVESQQQAQTMEQRLSSVKAQYLSTKNSLAAQQAIEGELADARQQLTAEMQRLLGQNFRRPSTDAPIGGVPVDSEYIIFIIDTSGSMQDNAWALVNQKVNEILDIYPQVKGIQVMNDMGDYMFSQYARRWIPDTPARRRAILNRLRNWAPFSNSSPVEGIAEAIRQFYASDKKISLYVFGDEFSHGSVEAVTNIVDTLNQLDAQGNRRVRIHGVGFPTQFQYQGQGQATGIRFAQLMRTLAQQNGGTFVGLSGFRP